MELGVTFPQTEIGPDPSVVRDYAQAAEDIGYTHLLAYDHVIAHPPPTKCTMLKTWQRRRSSGNVARVPGRRTPSRST